MFYMFWYSLSSVTSHVTFCIWASSSCMVLLSLLCFFTVFFHFALTTFFVFCFCHGGISFFSSSSFSFSSFFSFFFLSCFFTALHFFYSLAVACLSNMHRLWVHIIIYGITNYCSFIYRYAYTRIYSPLMQDHAEYTFNPRI